MLSKQALQLIVILVTWGSYLNKLCLKTEAPYFIFGPWSSWESLTNGLNTYLPTEASFIFISNLDLSLSLHLSYSQFIDFTS